MEKQKRISISLIILLVLIIIWGLLFFFDSRKDQSNGNNNEVGIVQQIKEQVTQKEISYYVDPLPYNVDEKYINSIREAISYWEKRENIIFKEVSSESRADIKVKWVKEFGGDHLGYAYGDNFIEIGLGDSFCLSKWRPYKYNSVLQIAIHEVGHVIGKSHSSNPQDIMYPTINTKYEIDVEETEVLPDGWVRFYPTCMKRDSAEYLFEVTSSEKLNIYIVPSKEEFDKLERGEEFNHYVDCYEEKTTSYKKNCVLISGGGIMLKNPSIFGLGADAQFTIKAREV